jgi:hypothetical protein
LKGFQVQNLFGAFYSDTFLSLSGPKIVAAYSISIKWKWENPILLVGNPRAWDFYGVRKVLRKPIVFEQLFADRSCSSSTGKRMMSEPFSASFHDFFN